MTIHELAMRKSTSCVSQFQGVIVGFCFKKDVKVAKKSKKGLDKRPKKFYNL